MTDALLAPPGSLLWFALLAAQPGASVETYPEQGHMMVSIELPSDPGVWSAYNVELR